LDQVPDISQLNPCYLLVLKQLVNLTEKFCICG